MITRAQLEALQLAKHFADAEPPDNAAITDYCDLLHERSDDLIDAAIGYVAMQEQSEFMYSEPDDMPAAEQEVTK